MIDKRVATAAEALEGLADGGILAVNGFGGAGVPATLLRGVVETGARDLTLISNSIRFVDGHAPELFEERRVAKVVCAAARGRGAEPSIYEKQIKDGTLDLELTPQGTLTERLRAGGSGIPAFYTPTGYGTAIAEGKESRVFNGKPCIMETALTADMALLRGARVDRWGNVIFKGTENNFAIVMAMAARVAVVETVAVEDAPLPPDQIHLPGIFVRRVVAVPDGRLGDRADRWEMVRS